MDRKTKLIKATRYLFDCKYDAPDFDDDTYEHSDAAKALIAEYGWQEVFECWFTYLKENCPSAKDVINFANLFFYYGGTEYPLRDPYPFIAYLYYRVNTKEYGAEATDIFDSITIPLLSNIGDVSLENEPDYVPEQDDKILAVIEKWKSEQDKFAK